MLGSGMHKILCAVLGICWLLQFVQAKPGLVRRNPPTLVAANHEKLKHALTSRISEQRNRNFQARKLDGNGNKIHMRRGSFSSDSCSSEPLSVKESNVITSPNYPDDYSNNADCKWTIVASGKQRIKLHFDSFDVENFLTCSFDALRMDVGHDVYTFCGDEDDGNYPLEDYFFPEDVKQVRLAFKSDSTKTRPGFHITVTLVNNDPCDEGQEIREEGVISSPGYPHDYPDNAFCQWRILAPEHKSIKLVVDDFMLESREQCVYDAVVITAGDQTITACGMYPNTTVLPDVLAFQTNDVQIIFHSDSSVVMPGFSLNVIFQDICSDVPFLVTESGAVITSPGYPHDTYPSNIECTWEVKAPAGMTIDVRVNHFELEESGFCSYDYLELGGLNSDPLKFCGSTDGFMSNAPPETHNFATNQIKARFVSDTLSNYLGFSIEVVFRGD